jgi:hypothetical protein
VKSGIPDSYATARGKERGGGPCTASKAPGRPRPFTGPESKGTRGCDRNRLPLIDSCLVS